MAPNHEPTIAFIVGRDIIVLGGGHTDEHVLGSSPHVPREEVLNL